MVKDSSNNSICLYTGYSDGKINIDTILKGTMIYSHSTLSHKSIDYCLEKTHFNNIRNLF